LDKIDYSIQIFLSGLGVYCRLMFMCVCQN
jgi:hypothetical protein